VLSDQRLSKQSKKFFVKMAAEWDNLIPDTRPSKNGSFHDDYRGIVRISTLKQLYHVLIIIFSCILGFETIL
jgi:hypothetical protein